VEVGRLLACLFWANPFKWASSLSKHWLILLDGWNKPARPARQTLWWNGKVLPPTAMQKGPWRECQQRIEQGEKIINKKSWIGWLAEWELKKPTHLYCLGFTFLKGWNLKYYHTMFVGVFDCSLIDYDKPWNGHSSNQPAWDEVFGPQNLKNDQTWASLMLGDLIYPKRSMVTLLPFNHTAKGSYTQLMDGWVDQEKSPLPQIEFRKTWCCPCFGWKGVNHDKSI